jgi:predicted transcriptional regulator of viral defense system
MRATLTRILKQNNGTLKASEARLAGVDNKELQRLAAVGLLERVTRGVYVSAADLPDEYLIAQYKCGKGIYSHETALYLHGLSDRVPLQLMMTIPSGYNTTLLKQREAYRFFYCKSDVYALGITTVLSPHENPMRVYNRERTLCDCIKKKSLLDADIVLAAVKQYMGESGIDLKKLLFYAEALKIRDTVRQYMEVLI